MNTAFIIVPGCFYVGKKFSSMCIAESIIFVMLSSPANEIYIDAMSIADRNMFEFGTKEHNNSTFQPE